jgi:diphthamide synthase (EF-2-diphthine--ammonia ligase)
MTKKVILSWSGGKDSALALYEIQESDNYEILGLLKTVTEGFDRISIHGVRQILVERAHTHIDRKFFLLDS